jgi:glycosyltransferase involved in cell wall biosynthesis
VAAGIVERYAALGHPIVYIHRTNRHGYKAGALDAGLKVAKGEFVAIFDADFVPPPDWLMKVIHHFAEPEIGMVQTRWTHLNRDYSMLTQIEAILLDGHFVHRARRPRPHRRLLQLQRHRRHVAHPGHRRRRRLAARHPHRRHRPQLPLADGRLEVQIPARGRVPVRAAHRDDRLQDAAGALGQGAHPDQHQDAALMFKSNVPRRIKVEAVYHLTANLSYPLMIVMSALLLPAMICRFYQGWFQMLLIDVPLFTASTFSIAVFYLMSQRELFPKPGEDLLYLPFLMALGIGLTVTNTKAVMEALFGIKSAFVRTPKYRVAKKGEKSQAAKYRKRLVLAPWIEMLIGCYFFRRHSLHLLQPQLLHRAVPDSVCHRLLVHRPDEPAARPLRALAHGRTPTPTNPAPSRSRWGC